MANNREVEPKNLKSGDLTNRIRAGCFSFSPGDDLDQRPTSYQQLFAQDHQGFHEPTKNQRWNEMRRLMTGKPGEDKGRVE